MNVWQIKIKKKLCKLQTSLVPMFLINCKNSLIKTIFGLWYKKSRKKKIPRVVPNGVNVSNRCTAVSLPLQQSVD